MLHAKGEKINNPTINSQHTDENQLELSRSSAFFFILFYFQECPPPFPSETEKIHCPADFLVEGQLWKLPSLVKVLLFFFFSGRLCLIEIHN